MVTRCTHLLPLVTASLRSISALCVLPVLPATSSSTSAMSVFSTCQPKTTSLSHLPCLVRFIELDLFIGGGGTWFYMNNILCHFYFSLLKEPKGRALPVPIPQYVKNRLITLCKDTVFNVRCSLCHKVLISHQAAQAHFKYVSF